MYERKNMQDSSFGGNLTHKVPSSLKAKQKKY